MIDVSAFAEDMTVDFWCPADPLPNWVFRRPFQDGDVRLMVWLWKLMGKRTEPKVLGSATISHVDTDTNTIWFSTPLPFGVCRGDMVMRK